MKKLFFIAAMAMFATVACGPTTDPVPPVPGNAPDVTIVAAPTSVKIAANGKLTATLSKAAEGDVIIAVANDKADVLTVGAEIKIAKGATSASIDFTGKAKGDATLTFTSSTATVKTASTKVSVTEGTTPPVEYEFPEFEWGTYSAIAKIVIGGTTIESSAGDSTEGVNKPLSGNDDFMIGGVSDDKTATIAPLTDGIPYTIFYNIFTSNEPATEMAVALYIDWNNDGKFTGAGEEIKLEKGIMASANKEITGTITIPADAAASSRVRAICYYVPGNDIKGGAGYSESGNVIDFMYSK